jgi:hypothetical protein
VERHGRSAEHPERCLADARTLDEPPGGTPPQTDVTTWGGWRRLTPEWLGGGITGAALLDGTNPERRVSELHSQATATAAREEEGLGVDVELAMPSVSGAQLSVVVPTAIGR